MFDFTQHDAQPETLTSRPLQPLNQFTAISRRANEKQNLYTFRSPRRRSARSHISSSRGRQTASDLLTQEHPNT